MTEKVKLQRTKMSDKTPFYVFRSSLSADESTYNEHHHTAFEITMVLSGNGIYSTKFSEFGFKSGDIFFFSTDEYHWIKKLDKKTDFLNIHFEPRFIWSDNFGISNKQLMKIFFNRKENPINKINREGGSADAIKELIYKIEKEAAEQKQEYETMLKIHLMNILVEMIRSYDGMLTEQDMSYTSQSLRYMELALNFIDENLEKDLTLDELSDVAHMSKTYFCAQFKKLNGISPWEYITIKRVERAIFYIETTDLTRIEIAAKCGYNNTSNFYYAFKKITGKTPSDYQRKK